MFSENYIAPIKKEFNDQLEKLMGRKKSNSVYLMNRERYQEFIREVKEIKRKKIKSFEDYRMLANYDIVEFNDKEKLIKPKDDFPNSSVKFYVSTDDLFGVLHTMHLLLNHADKDTMDREIKTKYCNVSKEVIKLYLPFCKVCRYKNSK